MYLHTKNEVSRTRFTKSMAYSVLTMRAAMRHYATLSSAVRTHTTRDARRCTTPCDVAFVCSSQFYMLNNSSLAP